MSTAAGSLSDGARGFIFLLKQLRVQAEAHFEWDVASAGGGDPSDYVQLCRMVEASIEAHVVHGDSATRQGWLRALTDLLCMVSDGCAVADISQWDPLRNTECAFAAFERTQQALSAVKYLQARSADSGQL